MFALEMQGGGDTVFLLLALDVGCSSEIEGVVLQDILAWAADWPFLLGLRLVCSRQSLRLGWRKDGAFDLCKERSF